MKYFDAHTHVQFDAFRKDGREVVVRAIESGIGMINAGTRKETSTSAVHLAEQFGSGVYAAVGLHPIHLVVEDYQDEGEGEKLLPESEFDMVWYEHMARNEKVVGIGECGLDFYRDHNEETIRHQKEIFKKHIELAVLVGKPLIVHTRNAFKELFEVFNEEKEQIKKSGCVLHFFTGSKDEAKKALELGCFFTFGGVITFSRDYDEVLRYIPADRVLSETDAPYVAPAPMRGKRNEPSFVPHIVQKIADIRGESEEKMREQIIKNVYQAFPSIK